MSEWRVSISDSVTGNVTSGTWGGERGDFTKFQATYEARGHPWAQSGSWSLWPNALSWAKCWGVGQTRLRRQGASPGRWERAGCGTQEGAREQTWRQWSAGHQTGRWAETPWGWDDATVTHWLQGPQQITKSLDTHQFSPSGTPWTAARQASLSITNAWSSLTLMSIESVMPSNHLILCYPLLLPPSNFSSIRVFSNESALRIRWPKYWSFSFNSEFSQLISFRMDWLDLLAVQGTLKSLLQYHSSKASILQCSAFFIVQLSHPYMTCGKTITLTRWTFVSKVMSLLFMHCLDWS